MPIRRLRLANRRDITMTTESRLCPCTLWPRLGARSSGQRNQRLGTQPPGQLSTILDTSLCLRHRFRRMRGEERTDGCPDEGLDSDGVSPRSTSDRDCCRIVTSRIGSLLPLSLRTLKCYEFCRLSSDPCCMCPVRCRDILLEHEGTFLLDYDAPPAARRIHGRLRRIRGYRTCLTGWTAKTSTIPPGTSHRRP